METVGMGNGPAAIHVASLNVCGLPSPLPPLAERATHFCRRIDESDIDVVNFQEVWGSRILAALRARLPSFPHVAWRRGVAGQPAGGLATFARVPLGVVSYTSFRGVRPDAGSVRFRAKRAVNSMLQGVLTVELPELGTVVGNTHLTANKDGDWSAGNRYHAFQRAQLGKLHGVVRRAGAGLVLLTGDFNIASASPLYPLIVDGGAWRDPFATTDPVTYHTAFLPPGYAGHRIDYVLVRGDPARFPVTGSGLLFAEPLALPDGRRVYLSDHVALTARIGLDVNSPGSPP
jgi:endonuclease/exonuclease/phosphatase family metal-dependent hydrolase